MGMFDTFICDTPLICESCGNRINSIQSKSFGCFLDVYTQGEMIKGSTICHGIVEEEIYCKSCRNHEQNELNKVYIVIWHGIFAGMQPNEEAALNSLKNIDRLDLLEWIEKIQNKRTEWKNHFHNLFSSISTFHDFKISDDKEKYLKENRLLQIFESDKYLTADDPLAEIIKEYEIYTIDPEEYY